MASTETPQVTETTAPATIGRPSKVKIGKVGYALPGTKVAIADDGEILLGGYNIMRGYWRNPEATADAIRDGWFHSGDLAVMYPDGYVKIKDRSKDIIISGGENISSLEVEDALYRHPAAGDSGCHTAPGLREPVWPLRGHRPWRSRDLLCPCRRREVWRWFFTPSVLRGCGGPALWGLLQAAGSSCGGFVLGT